MIKIIDNFLNQITMYRLVLYVLIGLLAIAAGFGAVGLMPYDPISIILSTVFLVVMSYCTNNLLAYVFKAQVNGESAIITALILALILSPIASAHSVSFLGWVAILAMTSKFVLAINRKHIFNPVAMAVVITSIGINQSASWWVGTLPMLVPVIIGGGLIVRKIRRGDMVFSFLMVAIVTTMVLGVVNGSNLTTLVKIALVNTPLFFLAFIMLTEPLTTPPGNKLQIGYGALVGFLSAPQIHIGSYYLTPEVALVVGNLVTYAVSPKIKMVLKLKEIKKLSGDTYDFIFKSEKKLAFKPGQYLEWTFEHRGTDSRGSRRYFTVASSPTEENIRIGVKFPDKSSSFKKSLLAMTDKSEIVASQLAGDFILPKDPNQKSVFVAGGIGITPFRSMVKYLVDTNQKRNIVLFYANRTVDELVYQDIFEEARQKLGIKTVYTITGEAPINWQGRKGRINEEMIKEEVPDFQTRTFYLSGPRAMVTTYEEVLVKMGVEKSRVVTDYFPGF